MSNSDYNRIAGEIRSALEHNQSFTLPLMKVADLSRVLACLQAMEAAA